MRYVAGLPVGDQVAIRAGFSLAFLFAANSYCFGATIDRPAALREYANAKPCCTSFATAGMELLQLGSEKVFQIDQRDQAFDFGVDGISFFKLFRLPEAGQPYSCEIFSHSLGDGRVLNVFFPQVKVLDGSFSELRSLTLVQGAAPTFNKMGGVSITVPVGAGDQANYLVVYTARSYVAEGANVQLQPRKPYLGAGAVPYVLSTLSGDNGNVHFLGSPISGKDQMEVVCATSK